MIDRRHHRRRLHPVTAQRIRRFHAIMALVWGPLMISLTVIPGAPLSSLKNSVPWLIAVSYYANMAAHLSGWAGESAAVAAEHAADVRVQGRRGDGPIGTTTSDDRGRW